MPAFCFPRPTTATAEKESSRPQKTLVCAFLNCGPALERNFSIKIIINQCISNKELIFQNDKLKSSFTNLSNKLRWEKK